MQTVYVVTGNTGKLKEFQAFFAGKLDVHIIDIDLPEIQTFDARELITDKVQRAYDEVGKPVLVEDVSIGLNHLNGFPGPFIKFVEQRLGKAGIFILAGEREMPATVVSTIGYYDGRKLIITEGIVHGTVVAPRGENGWGFDFCFVPEGETRTYAEMGPAEKNKVSHRSKSSHAFLEELKQL